ncbi:hypothetical protein [Streptomyces sp. NBC_01244]|uniref:hypothetical protein n=1 Tax=Streptomyces sp. NBC_01244 TaxID=2903797 RepID=UPI002E0D26DC|nr:hypothetical protein OG247_18890 [Streptomyces sp. NBC_01244]
MTSAIVVTTTVLGGLAVAEAAQAIPGAAQAAVIRGTAQAASVTGPVQGVPAQAASAPCPPEMSARQDGSLVVSSESDGTGVPDGLVVHLRDGKTGLRVASVGTFRKVTDPDGILPGFQLVSEPLKPAGLGIYTLEVGPEAGPVVCGDFDYRLRAVVTKVDAADGVSLDDLETTVSADVTTFDPRTGASAPLKNTKVRLSGERTSQEATTDAQGHLSSPFTFRGTENHTEVRVDVLDTPDLSAGGGGETARSVRRKAEIVLDPGSRKIKARYGSTAKITGQAVRIAADGTRKPVPEGTPMLADLTGEPRTDADGRFERQLRMVHDRPVKTTWAGGRSPWLQYAIADTEAEVVEGGYFTDVKATIDSARRVTFTGALAHKPLSRTVTGVEVQYSADGKTDWTTRTAFTVESGSDRFDRTLPGETDGYWRLRYAAAPRIEGSVTEPVRLTRTETEFTGFGAEPEPVRKGRPFTLTGTLRHESPARAYGDRMVLFYFQPAGSRDYVYQGYAKTAADGTFAHTFTAAGTGTWIARFSDVDGKHFNAKSRREQVTVNP